MCIADVADEDGLLLREVAVLAVGAARVNGVTEAEAFANGVAFDDLVAHVGSVVAVIVCA